MKVRRYENGFAVFIGRHRWDYWRPTRWLPLSMRHRVRWYGLIEHRVSGDQQ